MEMPKDGWTCCCSSCFKPLWKIKPRERYGSKWAADKTSFPGVPDYSTFWAKDGKTALNTSCPHCGQSYFKVVPVQVEGSEEPILVPKFTIWELDLDPEAKLKYPILRHINA